MDQEENTGAGAAYIEGRKQDAMERVKRANEHWQNYSEGEKALRTLKADDGV